MNGVVAHISLILYLLTFILVMFFIFNWDSESIQLAQIETIQDENTQDISKQSIDDISVTDISVNSEYEYTIGDIVKIIDLLDPVIIVAYYNEDSMYNLTANDAYDYIGVSQSELYSGTGSAEAYFFNEEDIEYKAIKNT